MVKPTRPSLGDIVKCWFPFDTAPDQPGPKLRPCLVLGTAADGRLVVAYGTTKADEAHENKGVSGGGEFVVPRSDFLALSEGQLYDETRFVLSRIVALPFDEKFFPSNKGRGKLNRRYWAAFQDAAREIHLVRTLARLGLRF